MDIRTELGRRILFCDGAMGTMLQAAGLPAGRLVPVTEAPAGAGENWAVLTRTPTE